MTVLTAPWQIDGSERQQGGTDTATNKQEAHERATPAQIADAPNGTLAHRNYACPALEAERVKFAPWEMRNRARRFAEGDPAFERALHPAVDHTVPPPHKEATFRWHTAPPEGTFQGRVYSDGSRLDGPSNLLARNGWAFVVLDDSDQIIASASGIPPDWIVDIPGTEAWALTQAARHALPAAHSSSTASLVLKRSTTARPSAPATKTR